MQANGSILCIPMAANASPDDSAWQKGKDIVFPTRTAHSNYGQPVQQSPLHTGIYYILVYHSIYYTLCIYFLYTTISQYILVWQSPGVPVATLLRRRSDVTEKVPAKVPETFSGTFPNQNIYKYIHVYILYIPVYHSIYYLLLFHTMLHRGANGCKLFQKFT